MSFECSVAGCAVACWLAASVVLVPLRVRAECPDGDPQYQAARAELERFAGRSGSYPKLDLVLWFEQSLEAYRSCPGEKTLELASDWAWNAATAIEDPRLARDALDARLRGVPRVPPDEKTVDAIKELVPLIEGDDVRTRSRKPDSQLVRDAKRLVRENLGLTANLGVTVSDGSVEQVDFRILINGAPTEAEPGRISSTPDFSGDKPAQTFWLLAERSYRFSVEIPGKRLISCQLGSAPRRDSEYCEVVIGPGYQHLRVAVESVANDEPLTSVEIDDAVPSLRSNECDGAAAADLWFRGQRLTRDEIAHGFKARAGDYVLRQGEAGRVLWAGTIPRQAAEAPPTRIALTRVRLLDAGDRLANAEMHFNGFKLPEDAARCGFLAGRGPYLLSAGDQGPALAAAIDEGAIEVDISVETREAPGSEARWVAVGLTGALTLGSLLWLSSEESKVDDAVADSRDSSSTAERAVDRVRVDQAIARRDAAVWASAASGAVFVAAAVYALYCMLSSEPRLEATSHTERSRSPAARETSDFRVMGGPLNAFGLAASSAF